MQKIRLTAFALTLVLVLTACNGNADTKTGEAKPAPASSVVPVMDQAGLDAYLKAHSGRPTLLMFWATWCPSCKKALPEMDGLSRSRGDKANVVAVSLDEDRGQLRAYLAQHPLHMQVFAGGKDLADRFGVEAIPTLIIFDKLGHQIFGKAGAFPQAMLEKVVDDLDGR